MCQWKLGEPRWVATVSRLDICARLAKIASRIKSRRRSDVYRINELVRAAKEWQKAPPHSWVSPGFEGKAKGDLGNRREKLRGGTSSVVGWSDAGYGDQLAGGKC